MKRRIVTIIIVSFILGILTGCTKEEVHDIIVTPPLTNTDNKEKEEEKAPEKNLYLQKQKKGMNMFLFILIWKK